MTKVHGHITRKGVKGTITQNGAFNWSYYWLTRYPSALTLTDNEELSITLNWTNNGTGYDGVKVERSANGINYSVIATLGVVATYDDTAPADGTYFYRVRYYKGSSYSAYSNIDSIAVEFWNPALSTPSAVTLSVISDTQIDGSFTINGTGQDGHKVYISTDNVTFTLLETLTGADNTFEATGLTEDTKYYFYVVAYRGDIESDASNTANATTWISEYNDVYVTFAEKPSNNFSSVYNNFLKGWIAAGYWARTDYLGISAIHSNTSNQAAKDWRNPSRTVTVVDTPPFTAKVGFDGPYPGTTHGYIKTGYNPGDGGSYNFTLNSGTFILHKSKDWTGGRVDVGSSDGTNQIYASINNAGNYLFRLNSSAYNALPIASQIGTWIFTRNNNTQIVNYEPDGTKKTSSIASTAIPNHEIYQLAINNAGTENFYTGAVGQGMLIFMNGVNDTEAADIKSKIAGFFLNLP